jgi:hypothetical protein
MRKSDRVEANRALLQSALIALRGAQATKIVQKGRAELDDEVLEYELIKGHELPYLTSDVWRVLLDGIERALQGDPDPFGLKITGKPPAFSRQELIDAIAAVLLAENDGIPRMRAITTVAEKTRVSAGELRRALADDDEVRMARLQLKLYPQRAAMLLATIKQTSCQD